MAPIKTSTESRHRQRRQARQVVEYRSIKQPIKQQAKYLEISKPTAFALEALISSWIFAIECGALIFLLASERSTPSKLMLIAVLVAMGLIIDDKRRARQPSFQDFNLESDWIWYMTAQGVSATALNYVVWHHGPVMLALGATSLLVFSVTRHLLRHHA